MNNSIFQDKNIPIHDKITLSTEEKEVVSILKKKYIDVQKEISDVLVGEFAAVHGFLSRGESCEAET